MFLILGGWVFKTDFTRVLNFKKTPAREKTHTHWEETKKEKVKRCNISSLPTEDAAVAVDDRFADVQSVEDVGEKIGENEEEEAVAIGEGGREEEDFPMTQGAGNYEETEEKERK